MMYKSANEKAVSLNVHRYIMALCPGDTLGKEGIGRCPFAKLIDLATLPLGYFFLYRLFGLPAIVVSIGANVAISTLTARVTTQKTISEQKLRELRKKQEGILHDLSANLPIWKLYGWSDFCEYSSGHRDLISAAT